MTVGYQSIVLAIREVNDQLATSVKHFSRIIARSRLCLAHSVEVEDPENSASRVTVARDGRPCALSHDIGRDSGLATAVPQS